MDSSSALPDAQSLFARHSAIVLGRAISNEFESAWLGHIPFARWITGALRPRKFVELGTHTGASYFAFCQAIVDANVQADCLAVDTWAGDEHAGEYGEDVFHAFARRHEEYANFSTYLRKTFDDALTDVADGSIDLLHIDGLHTYEASRHDFESWLPKLSDRAVILFHDIAETKADFGVWKLWASLERRFPSFAFNHEHGLGVLGVGKDLAPDLRSLFDLSEVEAEKFRQSFATVGIPVSELAERERRLVVKERVIEEVKKRWKLDQKVLAQQLTANEDLESELRNHELAIQDLSDRLNIARSYTSRLETKLDKAESKLREYRKKNKWLREKANRLVTELKESRQRLTAARSEIQLTRSSFSWKIGRLVLSPVHIARRATRLFTYGVTWLRLSRSGLFDPQWYVRAHALSYESPRRALWHFVRFGSNQGLDPAPDFSTAYYLRTYGDQLDRGANPLLHYYDSGAALGFVPKQGYDPRDRREEGRLYSRLLRNSSRRAASNGISFTVIMPFYNEAAFLEAAVASVRSQSYEQWELILVDDGSTDGSEELARKLAQEDSRIRVIEGAHAGASAARNKGLTVARGSFVAYLDADNTWDSRYLAFMAEFLLDGRFASAYAGQLILDDSGTQQGYRGRPFDWNACARSNFVDLNCFVHERRLVDERGGFDENLKRYVDWDLILRYTHQVSVGFLALPLSNYNEHSGSHRISKRHFSAFRSVVVSKQQSIRECSYRSGVGRLSLDIAIKIAAPTEKRNAWGDYHFARSLAHSLRSLGHKVRVDCLEAWYQRPAQVVVVLRGLNSYRRQPGEMIVLWSISHPDQIGFREMESADLLYVASPSTRDLFAPVLGGVVRVLPQATDALKFDLEKLPSERSGLAFVGNTRGVFRDAVRWAKSLELPLRLIGQGWRAFVPREDIESDLVSNEELPSVYRSASVVLNDHWESMRDFGYVSNRIFDAVATGAAVVSDRIPVLDFMFGPMVATASSAEEFEHAVASATVISESIRSEWSQVVRREHSFDARAQTILADVCGLLGVDAKTQGITPDAPPAFAGLVGLSRPRITGIARHGSRYATSSAYIRLVAPLTTEPVHHTLDFSLVRADSWRSSDIGDAVVVQRTAFDSLAAAEDFLNELESRNVPLIVDTDDDFRAMGFGHPELEEYEPLLTAHELLLSRASQNWFSTDVLAKSYQDLSVASEVVRNSVDPRIWRHYREEQRPPLEHGDTLQFLYMGTKTHAGDFGLVLPALDSLHESRPGSFSLTLVGIGDELPERPYITVRGPSAADTAYPRFARWLRRLGPFDVGLAPLEDTPFNRGKSDLKLLEYGALGVAPVFSNIGPYAEVGTKSEIGVGLPNVPGSWLDILQRFVDNPAAARQWAENARGYAYRERNAADAGVAMSRLLRDIV